MAAERKALGLFDAIEANGLLMAGRARPLSTGKIREMTMLPLGPSCECGSGHCCGVPLQGLSEAEWNGLLGRGWSAKIDLVPWCRQLRKMRPTLATFYASLSDEQKARFSPTLWGSRTRGTQKVAGRMHI